MTFHKLYYNHKYENILLSSRKSKILYVRGLTHGYIFSSYRYARALAPSLFSSSPVIERPLNYDNTFCSNAIQSEVSEIKRFC